MPALPLGEGGDERARVAALVALYQHIAATRMHGMPLLHPGLQVAAVGFEPEPPQDHALPAAMGVLLTPWFMNLVWLPLARLHRPERLGLSSSRYVGPHCFAFIGMHDEGLGSYAVCSLFSPVLVFEDQAAALATARSVLHSLRAHAKAPVEAPGRRSFLLGQGAARA
ncbi:[NiFe]-hydrogenase assembly chaperone HybE [Pseudorhodoferax sp. Leaf267]|uniref:[NiFe]-hydrogenase assembly chaperone HybE n=1 Tax=Pseudorhodoferax sp. Leaf267 TaxID=1736316 RepID=UPI0019105616|nr:[NiFe]-hydrogenase assembly chaperone HybE [Pseudorhodoferax sp. Leaf267]